MEATVGGPYASRRARLPKMTAKRSSNVSVTFRSREFAQRLIRPLKTTLSPASRKQKCNAACPTSVQLTHVLPVAFSSGTPSDNAGPEALLWVVDFDHGSIANTLHRDAKHRLATDDQSLPLLFDGDRRPCWQKGTTHTRQARGGSTLHLDSHERNHGQAPAYDCSVDF